MPIDVAVAQFAAGLDLEKNISECIALIEASADRGADLVVLPESAMHFNITGKPADAGAGQNLDEGRFVTAIRQAARRSGIAVLAGMTEALEGESRDSNTLIAVSRTGDLIGSYRKIHVFDAFGIRESDTILPGEIGRPLVFTVGDITVGALTCYDLRFPEAFRWVTDAGVDLIALPAAWAAGAGKEDHWRTLIRARAIENTVYVAAADQTGPLFCAMSRIVDPMGIDLAEAGEAPGLVSASVSRERIDEVRTLNPSLRNRRFTVAAR